MHYICTQCGTVTVQLEGAGRELSLEKHQNIKIIPLGPLQLRIGEIIQESKSYWALYAHHSMRDMLIPQSMCILADINVPQLSHLHLPRQIPLWHLRR